MQLGSMLIFGTIGVFRRYIPLSSAVLACTRGILGALFILIFIRVRGGSFRKDLTARTVIWYGVIGALMGINWILLFEAYNYTTVGIATLCYYMQPPIVMLLSPLVLKEKLTFKKVCCIIVATLGMLLVSGAFDHQADAGQIKGILLGFGAAVFYSAVILMNKKAPPLDAYQKTIIQLLAAGAIMLPYIAIGQEFGTIGSAALTIPLLLIVGLVHTGLAYVLYFGSMDGLKVQTLALLSYADPVFALILSALLLHEALTVSGVIGAILILGAAVFAEWNND